MATAGWWRVRSVLCCSVLYLSVLYFLCCVFCRCSLAAQQPPFLEVPYGALYICIYLCYGPFFLRISRGNSTKIPSPRMDPAERPTDPGRRGKEGPKGGIKKNQTRRCYAEKPSIFPDDRQTPARREARNHRSEDAKMLGPPPCGPQRTGRADQRDARGDAHQDRNPPNPRRPVLLCATQRPRSANNKTTTTMTRHPELRDPRSDPSDNRSRKVTRSLVEWY